MTLLGYFNTNFPDEKVHRVGSKFVEVEVK